MASKIQPLPGYILVEPKPKEEKTSSGIVLPDVAEEKPAEGRVLACGEAVLENGKTIKCPVKVGQTVIYKKWGGNDIKSDGKELLLLKFEDIMATVTK